MGGVRWEVCHHGVDARPPSRRVGVDLEPLLHVAELDLVEVPPAAHALPPSRVKEAALDPAAGRHVRRAERAPPAVVRQLIGRDAEGPLLYGVYGAGGALAAVVHLVGHHGHCAVRLGNLPHALRPLQVRELRVLDAAEERHLVGHRVEADDVVLLKVEDMQPPLPARPTRLPAAAAARVARRGSADLADLAQRRQRERQRALEVRTRRRVDHQHQHAWQPLGARTAAAAAARAARAATAAARPLRRLLLRVAPRSLGDVVEPHLLRARARVRARVRVRVEPHLPRVGAEAKAGAAGVGAAG